MRGVLPSFPICISDYRHSGGDEGGGADGGNKRRKGKVRKTLLERLTGEGMEELIERRGEDEEGGANGNKGRSERGRR